MSPVRTWLPHSKINCLLQRILSFSGWDFRQWGPFIVCSFAVYLSKFLFSDFWWRMTLLLRNILHLECFNVFICLSFNFRSLGTTFLVSPFCLMSRERLEWALSQTSHSSSPTTAISMPESWATWLRHADPHWLSKPVSRGLFPGTSPWIQP